MRDLVPALLQPHGARLRLEVRELTTRHLMQVNFGCRGLHAGLKRDVLAAHGLPVIRHLADFLDIEAGVAFGMRQGFDD